MKAQNTIEFSVTLGIMMLFTLFMSTALSIAIAKKVEDKQLETLLASLREVSRGLDTAVGASHGYRTTIDLQTPGVGNDFVLELKNEGEIVITNSRNYSLIEFLDADYGFHGQICNPEFEIWKDEDYGVGMCCGSCGTQFPTVNMSLHSECKVNESGFWDDCNNITASSYLSNIRSRCSLSMDQANFSLYQNSLSTYLFSNQQSDDVVVRDLDKVWVSLNLTDLVDLNASGYRLEARCYNETSNTYYAYNFTVS